MADYNLVYTNTPLQQTRVPENPGPGQVQYVGATDSLQVLWPNSVLVNENIIPEGANTLSLRTRVPGRDSVNTLTGFALFCIRTLTLVSHILVCWW